MDALNPPNPEKTHMMWESTHREEAEWRRTHPDQEFPGVKTQEFSAIERNPSEQQPPERPWCGPYDGPPLDFGEGFEGGVFAVGFMIFWCVSVLPFLAPILGIYFLIILPGLIWRGLKALGRGIQRLTGHKTRELEPKPVQTIQTNFLRNHQR